MTTLTALAAQLGEGEAVPPEVWGGGFLFVLLALLVAVLIFGKGRPHA
ncbi:MAG: hypothetical protein ICV70_05255 [Jiangellaceae bacterium]|nr:hypothetical protein [Jiangellaceae bacterium]